MGVITSRIQISALFKKTPDAFVKELESINQKIQDLELKNTKTRHHHSIINELILTYSKILYVLVAVVFFFSTLPSSIIEFLFVCGPLICFHVFVYGLKASVDYYYQNEINKNVDAIMELKSKKKNTLNEVKENFSFKEASEIIKKYKPEMLMIINDTCSRKLSGHLEAFSEMTNSAINIIFGEKSKNALICANCQWHNGMALEEECENMGFRCYHCSYLNLPREKQLAKVD